MKTYEELQKEWGSSTCGKSIELFIYDELQKEIEQFQKLSCPKCTSTEITSHSMEEGYYRLNGTKRILYWTGEIWMKAVKDQQGRLGSWLGHLEKQPKVKTAEYINCDLNKNQK